MQTVGGDVSIALWLFGFDEAAAMPRDTLGGYGLGALCLLVGLWFFRQRSGGGGGGSKATRSKNKPSKAKPQTKKARQSVRQAPPDHESTDDEDYLDEEEILDRA